MTDGAMEKAMPPFDGVKIFSATKFRERDDLGDVITKWIRDNPHLEIVDRVVRQSSDSAFHCVTIIIFFRNRDG